MINNRLEQLLSYYEEPYIVKRNITIDNISVYAFAQMNVRSDRTFMGALMPNLKLGTSSAGELISFLHIDTIAEDGVPILLNILDAMEKEYMIPDEDHCFTFISLIILAENITSQAAARIKRYSCHKNYQNGVGIFRVVVIDNFKKLYASKDGKDLGKLTLKRIKQK